MDRLLFVEIVGNGNGKYNDPKKNSNARALDWNGNEYLNGDLYVNCNPDSSGGEKVATESVIQTLLARIAALEARVDELEGYHVPANAVLGEDGTPMTDEQGNYIEYDT